MPAQDELLLKVMEQGSGDVVKDLDRVADGLDQVTDSTDKSAKGFKRLTVGAADLKAGLDIVKNVGGKVVDFLKDAVESTGEYAAQVRDLSRAIGANAEETSALMQVADDVTVSVGTLEAAFKAAIKNGIAPNIETLAKLADEYNAIQDPVLRSQFAMEKFGRAGLEMAKILEQGGEAIKDAAKEAKALGLTLNDQDVQAARDLEIQMDNLGDKFEAVKTSLAKGLIPRLVEFFDTIDKGLKTADLLLNWNNKIHDGIKTMGADLLAGKVSYDEYASAVVGAAVATGQMSQAEADALLNGTAQISLVSQASEQFGLYSREAYNVTQGLHAQTAALDSVGFATQRLVEYGKTQSAQAAATLDYQRASYTAYIDQASAITASAEASKRKAEMDAEAAKADAIYRAGISETIGKVDSLAQSLKTSTDAQAKQILAQAQLDVLKKAFEDGTISQEGFNKATDAVLLRYDLATPKSLAMAETQQKVNEAFLAGKLPLDEYVKTSEKIPKIAEDGKITMDELTRLGIKPTTQATVEQTGKVDLLSSAWQHVPREVVTIYRIQQEGDIPARAYGGPVSAGMPYMVGERGPEMFVPNQSGNIISNSSTTNYNVTTDRTGLAFLLERQRMAEGRMYG